MSITASSSSELARLSVVPSDGVTVNEMTTSLTHSSTMRGVPRLGVCVLFLKSDRPLRGADDLLESSSAESGVLMVMPPATLGGVELLSLMGARPMTSERRFSFLLCLSFLSSSCALTLLSDTERACLAASRRANSSSTCAASPAMLNPRFRMSFWSVVCPPSRPTAAVESDCATLRRCLSSRLLHDGACLSAGVGLMFESSAAALPRVIERLLLPRESCIAGGRLLSEALGGGGGSDGARPYARWSKLSNSACVRSWRLWLSSCCC